MFFQSVRHHLQSKVARSRHLKLSSSSPLTKRKKPLEKSVGNLIVNEWDIEEEDNTDKATVVRNSRRSTPTVKQLKKQTVNYGKLRYDQSQSRGKQNVGERSMKSSMRKDKVQSAKKRNERFEKRVASVKGNICWKKIFINQYCPNTLDLCIINHTNQLHLTNTITSFIIITSLFSNFQNDFIFIIYYKINTTCQ